MVEITIAEALKKFAVALGFGSNVNEYTGEDIENLLYQMAVKMQCASQIADVRAQGIAGLLNYIAENYGSEEKEPYDLTKTETHATVTFKRNGKTLNAGRDILYNGDKIKITAVAAEGYEMTSLTVNGNEFTSGNEFTVNGHNITVVATGTIKTFGLARTVDDNCAVAVAKGGESVDDGEGVLTYGDEISITATAGDGYVIKSLTVNGEDFVSGETLTVADDVTIVATSEAE